jgi:spore germination cell wall hydrolase CwlJ-like protein
LRPRLTCTFPALVILIAVSLIPSTREDPLPAPADWTSAAPTFGAADAELEADAFLLAQLATGEDPRAGAAVAWVALNRSGCRVAPLRCREPLLRTVSAHRQFGTVRRGVWHPAWTPSSPARSDVQREVWRVLLGAVPDPTGGATHFHRLGTWTPPWAPSRRAWRVHGSHAFYRPPQRTVVKS